MNWFLVFLFVLFYSSTQAQPPFSGTIFNFPESFVDTDPSMLDEVTYVGREQKNVFDRRTNRTNINAYIFAASFKDESPDWEITVNPEFSLEEATTLAEKYSFNIGQMPLCIREGVSGAVIHDGDNLWGGGDPLTIHHGQGENYGRRGIITETMIHESTHAEFDRKYYTSEWRDAANADGEYISTYARDYPTREDHSETFLCWLVATYKKDRISESDFNRITSTVPNRMEFYQNQNLKLSPVVMPPNLPIINLANSMDMNVQYNPVHSTVTLDYSLKNRTMVFLQILDAKGRVFKTLSRGWGESGKHSKTYQIGPGSNSRSGQGLYVIQLKTDEYSLSQPIRLIAP